MSAFDEFLEEQQVDIASSLPEILEAKIDFDTGEYVTSNDEIVIVSGTEALRVWAWKSLLTFRNKYSAYSSSFGNDLNLEIGTIYDVEIKKQILISEIEDSLMVNPYFKRVYDFVVTSDETGRYITINFKIEDIYNNIIEREVSASV